MLPVATCTGMCIKVVFTIKTEVRKILLGTGEDQVVAS